MAQARGSAHVAATAVLIMVTMSIMLIHCQAYDWNITGPHLDQKVKKGGSITFKYAGKTHNAIKVDAKGNCLTKGVATTGPETVSFPDAGTFYVICSVATHCSDGKMRVKVIVTAT